jgi:hypothetical protein
VGTPPPEDEVLEELDELVLDDVLEDEELLPIPK